MSRQTGQSQAFRVRGLDCAEEVAVLKREIGPLVGGEEKLSFDVLNAKMIVSADVEVTTTALVEAVARTGMMAEPWMNQVEKDFRAISWKRSLLTGLSGGALLAGTIIHTLSSGIQTVLFEEGSHPTPLLVAATYILSIGAGTFTVLPKAWSALKRLRPDMNLLMLLAVIGAIAIGQWLEAATVAFLFSLSLALESWSINRARRAVGALMALSAPEARFLGPDGNEAKVPPEEVPIGGRFRVLPGERVPLDGRILQGSGSLDQSPITGESLTVEKSPGDEVFAGSINKEGSLIVQSTKASTDTLLARISSLVTDAQARRAPSEQWVEVFAAYYTPSVMFLAAALFLLPPLLLNAAWGVWFYRALVLLVIACPCALVISTPVSIVAALASAAKNGVLIKGGMFVEAPARLKVIALDKTGTLTNGKPQVVEVIPIGEHRADEVLQRAAALEAHSTHPLGMAILEHSKQQNLVIPVAESFINLPGRGGVGEIDGKRYWLGSHRSLLERRQETQEVLDRLESLALSGKAVVIVGTDEHVCGFITLSDTVRPEARQAISDLRALRIEHLVMVTGDNHGTAAAVANAVGIDEFYAELLPEDKAQKIEGLVQQHKTVAMIGDGVNDTPAMASSSVALAMGAIGSDAAIETADIALMSDDLSKLPWLISHSRRTLLIIRQNILFALAIKAVFVVLTLFGYSSMWAAVAADSGATLLVVANALRLLRQIPDRRIMSQQA